ncbi:MAG: sugar-binding protein, partial [Kiritimatiellae bacterium]|nr:sugar-binding protein [Kiritimatiellia bacterium]
MQGRANELFVGCDGLVWSLMGESMRRKLQDSGRIIGVLLMCVAPALAQMTAWSVRTADGSVSSVTNDTVILELATEGACVATGSSVALKPGESLALSFGYHAANLLRRIDVNGLSPADITELTATITWYNAAGQDVDERLLALGFPPTKRLWTFDRNGQVEVADNVMAPELSTCARVSFALTRVGGGPAARVSLSNVRLAPGQTDPKGVAVPDSGPTDAGPLSVQPEGFRFGSNLVTNAALEEGEGLPDGWTLLGDNSQGAPLWRQGGAYSGKRCLQIYDRGPYINSWDNKSGLYVPGGVPTPARVGAREEVSARFASVPVPVVTGAYYQASAMLWFLRRTSAESPWPFHAVRIQFLDAAGRTLPYRYNGEDLLTGYDPVALPGWRMAITHPVPAPANARSVRVVVAMTHATYYIGGPRPEIPVKIPEERGFVLVDNIALYRVPVDRLPSMLEEATPRKTSPGIAYRTTIRAGSMPFVPTSPAHRPNSLTVETEAERPCGVIVAQPGEARRLWLRVENLLGDLRSLEIRYGIEDWLGRRVATNAVKVELKPFEDTSVKLTCPAGLPYGPYTLRYMVSDSGRETDSGESRFAVIRPNGATYDEKGRMDYPFGTWCYMLGPSVLAGDLESTRLLGEFNRMAGVGKQGFCHAFSLAGLDAMTPEQLARAVSNQAAQVRAVSKAVKQYGMHYLCPVVPADEPVPPERYPALTEAMRRIVETMKDQVDAWIYADEYINGHVTDLDISKHPDGSKVMGWGRRGTGRQFWNEYLACYDGAKQADPDCLFGPESAADATGNVLRLFFEKMEHRRRLDFFGINMFGSVFGIWPPQIVELKKVGLENLLLCGQNFVAYQNAPATGPMRVREEAEAVQRMVRYYAEALYAFPQLFFLPQWGWILADEPGSFSYLKRPRPQYVAYANMTDCLGAGRFVAKHELPGGVLYVRRRSARSGLVGVIWSTAAGAMVELDVGARSVTVSDVWGNRQKLRTKRGVAPLTLTPMPQYILGARRLRPAPSVKLALANTSTCPLAPEVTVTVVNERQEAIAGALELRSESAIAVLTPVQQVQAIPSGASKSFRFRVAPIDLELDKPLALRARLTAAGGRTYESVDGLNFHFAVSVASAPAIDGALTDWSDACPFVGNREEQLYKYQNQNRWLGPEEFSGRLWMRWDTTNLYLAAKIRDRNFNPAPTLQELWASDAIEMAFDLTGSLNKAAKVTQIALGQTRDGRARVYRYAPAAKELNDAVIAVRRDGLDTHIEAAIPWLDLSPDFVPASGATISAVFGFNDCDEGLRMMSWFNRVSGLDAAGFGRIRLVDAANGARPPGAMPSTPTNVLAHGALDYAALPSAWKITIPADRENKPTGRAYLETGRLCLESTVEQERQLTVETWTVPVTPGEEYLFRVQAKGLDPVVWLNTLNASGALMESGTGRILPLTPATTTAHGRVLFLAGAQLPDRGACYAPLAAIFTVPPQAARLQLCFSKGWMKGAVSFDD